MLSIIKIFFEEGYADQFDSTVDSFRHYIHSAKEISERRKKLHTEFINAAVKLFRVKVSPGNDFKIDHVKKEILDNKYSSSRNGFWRKWKN